MSQENTLDKVKNVTRESVELFQKQDFILQKWNSNVSASKSNNVDAESELTYVNKYLVTMKVKLRLKLEGWGWNKSLDEIPVVIPSMKEKKANHRNELSQLVYDLCVWSC